MYVKQKYILYIYIHIRAIQHYRYMFLLLAKCETNPTINPAIDSVLCDQMFLGKAWGNPNLIFYRPWTLPPINMEVENGCI